jgi:hypothetical protein
MAFISHNPNIYDVPATSYMGLARDRIIFPHIVCLTINGQDMTVGVPVTTAGVQTLTNKSLADNSTFFIAAAAPTRRIRFDATGVTLGATLIIQPAGNGTIALPDPAGGTTTLLSSASNQTVTGIWTFNNATASTSTITGAIIDAGGLGVAGAIHAGGDIVGHSVTASTSTITGAIIDAGGLGVAGAAHIGGDIVGYSATASTSAITGAIIDAGGLGVAGAIHAGGDIVGHSVTASTSTITGAIVSAGGLGVAGAIHAGGVIVCDNVTASTSAATGSITTAGGLGVAGAAHIGGDIVGHAVTASTSTITGAIVSAGGIGAAGAINSLSVATTSVTDATSRTAAANVFAGGVASNLRVWSANMSCDTAPVATTDVVRLLELNAITSTTTLNTSWNGTTVPGGYTQVVVFRKVYNLVFALFCSVTYTTATTNTTPTLLLFDNIPDGYRPRTETQIPVRAYFNSAYTDCAIVAYGAGNVSLYTTNARTPGFVNTDTIMFYCDNPVYWYTSI